MLIAQDEIDNYVRVFSGNKYCVYRTLTVDIGMNSYATLPAWGCFTSSIPLGDYDLENTTIQRNAADTFSFFFGKTSTPVVFDKPVKFAFDQAIFQ